MLLLNYQTTDELAYPLKYETSLIFHKWQNSFVYKHSKTYSIDSPFETSHLPWPVYINWTPATPCSWRGPGLFLWRRTFSQSPIRKVCKRHFYYTNLLAHWLYGTLITLAPLRQGPIIFFSLSFASFPLLLSLAVNSTPSVTSHWSFPIPC